MVFIPFERGKIKQIKKDNVLIFFKDNVLIFFNW